MWLLGFFLFLRLRPRASAALCCLSFLVNACENAAPYTPQPCNAIDTLHDHRAPDHPLGSQSSRHFGGGGYAAIDNGRVGHLDAF